MIVVYDSQILSCGYHNHFVCEYECRLAKCKQLMQKFFSNEESCTHGEELCIFFNKLFHFFQLYTLIALYYEVISLLQYLATGSVLQSTSKFLLPKSSQFFSEKLFKIMS